MLNILWEFLDHIVGV